MDLHSAISQLKDSQPTQWQQVGSFFSPSKATVEQLPAGHYKIVSTFDGIKLFYQPIHLDNLIRIDHDNNANRVIADIRNFWDSKALYERLKIPYRRGILMSGPPGTGKTCIIRMVISDLIQRGGICIESENVEWLQGVIGPLIKIQPDTPVLVILDDFEDEDDQQDLLAIMDGVDQMHGVVFLAATNHPSALKQSLINRPGRFDRHIIIGYPNINDRLEYITNFSAGILSKSEILHIAHLSDKLSFGHIKELLVGIII